MAPAVSIENRPVGALKAQVPRDCPREKRSSHLLHRHFQSSSGIRIYDIFWKEWWHFVFHYCLSDFVSVQELSLEGSLSMLTVPLGKKKKRSKEKASCLLMSKILIWVLKTRSVVKDPVQPWRFASLTGIQVWREMPMPLLNYFWSFQRTVFYLLKTWNTRHLVAKVAACKLTAAKCVRLFKSLIKLHSLSISQEAACFYATACLSHLISDPSGKQISWLFQPAH